MTVCIAGICTWKGQKLVLLCADYQGTRGDYLKAEDTYKFWHFHTGLGAIAFAGDIDAGKEFMRRFTAAARQFEEIEKKPGDGDIDIRLGQYLRIVRDLVRTFMSERRDDHISARYSISLAEFYSPEAPAKLSPQRYDEIFAAIKAIDLGAEFLIAYIGDEEPIILRIERSGHVSIEDGRHAAIGSGEPLATAVLTQIEGDAAPPSLPECLTWIYQAKLTAERNPYVGDRTSFWVLFPGGKDKLISDRAWEIVESSVPKSTLAKVSPELIALGDGILATHRDDGP